MGVRARTLWAVCSRLLADVQCIWPVSMDGNWAVSVTGQSGILVFVVFPGWRGDGGLGG